MNRTQRKKEPESEDGRVCGMCVCVRANASSAGLVVKWEKGPLVHRIVVLPYYEFNIIPYPNITAYCDSQRLECVSVYTVY